MSVGDLAARLEQLVLEPGFWRRCKSTPEQHLARHTRTAVAAKYLRFMSDGFPNLAFAGGRSTNTPSTWASLRPPMAEVRFIVAQIGARHGYAVPAVLEQAGLLERFYTDLSGDIGWGRQIARARCVPGLRSSLSRLAGRRLPGGIRDRTRTFAWPAWDHALRARRTGSGAAAFRAQLRFSDALGRAMARAGYGAATHVYSMLGECPPFLIEASRRGLKVVSEVYIPLEHRTSACRGTARLSRLGARGARLRRDPARGMLEDVLLTRAITSSAPRPPCRMIWSRTSASRRAAPRSCPTACTDDWLAVEPRPARGRILFVGEANLRKGIHYFAMAAARLRRSGHDALRVAGGVTPHVAEQSLCRGLEFSRPHPSRSASMRSSPRRTCSCCPRWRRDRPRRPTRRSRPAVPVVTTRAAGSVVRDGIEGRIVPERDPVALADAIAEIVEDRDKRARMSVAARERRATTPGSATASGSLAPYRPCRANPPWNQRRCSIAHRSKDGSRRSQCHAAPRSREWLDSISDGRQPGWRATEPVHYHRGMGRSATSPLSVISGSGAMVFRRRDAPAGGLPRTLPAGRRTTAVDVGAHLGHFALALAASGLMRSTRSNRSGHVPRLQHN